MKEATQFYRNAIEDLKYWIKRPHRKPLVIRGARQVGKSTLVRNFCYDQKIELFEINFEIKTLKTLKSETLNPEELFLEIEALFDKKINQQTLLFFDEIQRQPNCLAALRYFFELRPDVPVIAAGSLLDFVLKEHTFSMPVGRIEYLFLGPLTFSEFLKARNKNLLWEQVTENFKNKKTNTEAQHELLTQFFQEYIYVGGMPEAIKIFKKTKDPIEVRKIHTSVLQTYKDDFSKYTTRSSILYLNEVFDHLPNHIGLKIKYSAFSNLYETREIKKAIELLLLAGLIFKCVHTNAAGVPIKSQTDNSVFKLFFLDVGLLNSLLGVTWSQCQDYQDEILVPKGMIAEQFVAQHLAFSFKKNESPQLFYWLRDKKSENAEVDFIIEKDNKVFPIEVKSGQKGKLKSLFQFVFDKKINVALRLDLKFRKEIFDTVKTRVINKTGTHEINFKLNQSHLALIEKWSQDSQ